MSVFYQKTRKREMFIGVTDSKNYSWRETRKYLTRKFIHDAQTRKQPSLQINSWRETRKSLTRKFIHDVKTLKQPSMKINSWRENAKIFDANAKIFDANANVFNVVYAKTRKYYLRETRKLRWKILLSTRIDVKAPENFVIDSKISQLISRVFASFRVSFSRFAFGVSR